MDEILDQLVSLSSLCLLSTSAGIVISIGHSFGYVEDPTVGVLLFVSGVSIRTIVYFADATL